MARVHEGGLQHGRKVQGAARRIDLLRRIYILYIVTDFIRSGLYFFYFSKTFLASPISLYTIPEQQNSRLWCIACARVKGGGQVHGMFLHHGLQLLVRYNKFKVMLSIALAAVERNGDSQGQRLIKRLNATYTQQCRRNKIL